MNRNEAFKAMIDGHKVTHKSLMKDQYYYFAYNGFYLTTEQWETGLRIGITEIGNEDGYEIYTEKKTEKVTWYRVSYHRIKTKQSWFSDELFKSKEDFLKDIKEKESDFHWIKLEEVYTHEYLTE